MRRRLALIAALIVLTASQARATVPGDACAGGEANQFGWSALYPNTGFENGMFCNGSTWQSVINFQSTGNVGIGTTTPANTLDVNGQMSLASVTGAAAPTTTAPNYSEITGNSNNGTLAAGGTYYGPVDGDFTMVSGTDTSTYTRNLVSRAATVQNLYYLASAANSAGKTNTITVMKNGVATALTCSVTAVTTCNDTTHSFSVAAGDEIGIKIVTGSATNTAVKHSWSIELSY